MDTDRYDIVAKAEVDGPQMDTDVLWTLLRALLAERFKLAVHTENRPAEAYTLVAVKPKLKKSDPGTRTKCKEGPGQMARTPGTRRPFCRGCSAAKVSTWLSLQTG